jgi:hypothetical protein
MIDDILSVVIYLFLHFVRLAHFTPLQSYYKFFKFASFIARNIQKNVIFFCTGAKGAQLTRKFA